MSRGYIPARAVANQWLKDPAIKAAYDALEDEFALAGALVKARGDAGMTQEQVAQAMGTTQAVVARLESGRVMPHVREFKACLVTADLILGLDAQGIPPVWHLGVHRRARLAGGGP